MRYVILGGCGFLGSWLVRKLLKEENNQVLVYDRVEPFYSSVVSAAPDRFRFIQGTFDIKSDFDSLLSAGDVVFHLISTTVPGDPCITMQREIMENVLPTARLLESCKQAEVEKIVFFSSGGTIYGPQTDMIPIHENIPANPISLYGIQKVLNEKIIRFYGNTYGLDYLIIRLANPFGPYQNHTGRQGAVTTFVHNILEGMPILIYGDGNIVRDYIDVRDAIDMVLNICSTPGRNRVYNVGSGSGVSLNELVATAEKIIGKEADIRYVGSRMLDVPYNVLSIDKYRSEISDVQPRTLETGIKTLVQYFKGGMVYEE